MKSVNLFQKKNIPGCFAFLCISQSSVFGDYLGLETLPYALLYIALTAYLAFE